MNSTTPRNPNATPKPQPKPDTSMQRAWLQQAAGSFVRVRLIDGKVISGQLVASDTYTILVKLGDEPEPCLVFKSAIAYLLRGRREASK